MELEVKTKSRHFLIDYDRNYCGSIIINGYFIYDEFLDDWHLVTEMKKETCEKLKEYVRQSCE